MESIPYEVYYWGACGDFYGRALAPLLILEESGTNYTIKDQSELPAGLGAWWNKMLKTKAVRLSVPSMASTSTPSTRVFFAQVAALKGKGKKLMPGEHNKAW